KRVFKSDVKDWLLKKARNIGRVNIGFEALFPGAEGLDGVAVFAFPFIETFAFVETAGGAGALLPFSVFGNSHPAIKRVVKILAKSRRFIIFFTPYSKASQDDVDSPTSKILFTDGAINTG